MKFLELLSFKAHFWKHSIVLSSNPYN